MTRQSASTVPLKRLKASRPNIVSWHPLCSGSTPRIPSDASWGDLPDPCPPFQVSTISHVRREFRRTSDFKRVAINKFPHRPAASDIRASPKDIALSHSSGTLFSASFVGAMIHQGSSHDMDMGMGTGSSSNMTTMAQMMVRLHSFHVGNGAGLTDSNSTHRSWIRFSRHRGHRRLRRLTSGLGCLYSSWGRFHGDFSRRKHSWRATGTENTHPRPSSSAPMMMAKSKS